MPRRRHAPPPQAWKSAYFSHLESCSRIAPKAPLGVRKGGNGRFVPACAPAWAAPARNGQVIQDRAPQAAGSVALGGMDTVNLLAASNPKCAKLAARASP